MLNSTRESATSSGFPLEARTPARLVRAIWGSPSGMLGATITLLFLLAALFADRIGRPDPFALTGGPLASPTWAHPMGTDDLGRDVLSGVLHGTRTSMIVMVAVMAMTAIIGIIVGGVAGYRGGLIDDLLMRLTEVVQSLPRFFLAVVALAFFGAGVDRVIIMLGLTSWPMLARVVRAEALAIKQREFVEAARAGGASHTRILLRHVLPQVAPSAVVVVSVTAATAILLEASLSFVGLGDPNVMSLGSMASNAQRFMRAAWWMVAFPGAAIAAAVIGLNLLGDALNQLMDPFRGTGPAEPARTRGGAA